MKAEFLKLRYLPTPRWIAAALASATLIVGVVMVIVAPSNPAKYISVPQTVNSLSAWVATMILGVWLATLEFNSGTLQRTLTAEPDRNRVLAAKLGLVLLVATVTGVAVAAAAGGIAHVAASRAGFDLADGELAGALFGQAPEAVTAAAIGFGFGLLSRLLGGGLAFGILFVLVFDGFISFIPGASRYTFGQLSEDLSNGITGDGETRNVLAVAIIGCILWCLVIVIPGWVRFLRADLK